MLHQQGKRQNAYTLLKEIYEHLTLPRVLVLMTLDEKMLRNSVERYMESAFEMESRSQQQIQASQLLAKILPTYHRIYTPNYTYNVWTGAGNKKQQIYVRLPKAMQQELVLTEEPIPAKKLNLCLLAERTGVYFDALGKSSISLSSGTSGSCMTSCANWMSWNSRTGQMQQKTKRFGKKIVGECWNI